MFSAEAQAPAGAAAAQARGVRGERGPPARAAPYADRCSVLLESLQEELRTTGAEIQAFLGGGPPAPQHDYVVEFYDGKVRQLEALLDEHARERTQAAQLRVHVQELERALGDKEQDRLRHLQAAAQLRQGRGPPSSSRPGASGRGSASSCWS